MTLVYKYFAIFYQIVRKLWWADSYMYFTYFSLINYPYLPFGKAELPHVGCLSSIEKWVKRLSFLSKEALCLRSTLSQKNCCNPPYKPWNYWSLLRLQHNLAGLRESYPEVRRFCEQRLPALSLADCIVFMGTKAVEIGMEQAGINSYLLVYVNQVMWTIIPPAKL